MPQQGADLITGMKVLVVDDTASNRQVLQVFLTKLGCRVALAEDGARAIEQFAAESPDLVLMDVMMPGMDGFEATRRIKAASRDRWVPVVFVSALHKDENLVAGLDAGGDDYLSKPVNFVILQAKLRSIARTLYMQRSLDEARRRTEAIAENIVDGIVTIDDRGIMVSVNPAMPNIFGYEQAEELVGRNVSMLMPEPDRSAHDGYISAYLRGGMPNVVGLGQMRRSGQRKDGTVFPIELGVTELRFEGRRLFVGILRDIGERVAVENALRERTEALQRYRDEREAENALAAGIMERLTQRHGSDDARVHRWLMSASDHFCGDAIATARSPDGRLYVLLADATGHGLAAAVSIVPVLTAFYSLVDHGYPLGYLAYEINRQLMAFLPTGRFVAASLVCVDADNRSAEVWVGGMPAPLLIGPDGALIRRFPPAHPPLGIVEFDEGMTGVEKFDCPPDSQLALCSDGLIEAGDGGGDGEAFGEDFLLAALAAAEPENRLAAVFAAFNAHIGGGAPHDDISLLLVDC